MKIETYYRKLNKKSQVIFSAALGKPHLLSKAHSAASNLYKLSACITDVEEAKMLQLVCSQLESSCLALTFGLYRPALSSLRQAFELGMGGIYFSSNKLAHREWANGVREADLKWSVINSPETGVLSQRFAKAFFPELANIVESYQDRSRTAYRCLSEYVHGNSDTWKTSGMTLTYNQPLENLYISQFDEIDEILMFAFCCRYLRDLNQNQIEDIHPILNDKLSHVEPIRVALGGPKDIK